MGIDILTQEIRDTLDLKKMKYQFDFMMLKQMMWFGMLLQDLRDRATSMIKVA